jgi:hypothetical protein
MEPKDLEAQYKSLWMEIEKLKATSEIDFSKYVRKGDRVIAIMWNNMLKSFSYWTISYDNVGRVNYDKTPKYTITKLSELKEDDVFIRKDDIRIMALGDFKIFSWVDRMWSYICQFLIDVDWIEIIDRFYENTDWEVYKFLRD